MSMMEFNVQNYYLVVGEGGEPVVENEKLVLQNINDDIIYVDITVELLTEFGITREDVDILPEPSPKGSINSETCSFSWTHKATLLFLEEYKKRHAKFRDPKHKRNYSGVKFSKKLNYKDEMLMRTVPQ